MIVCFNPSPFTEELKLYPLQKVDWLLLNSTEGMQLSGSEDPKEIINILSAKYKNTKIVLTLGKEGVICFDGEKSYYQESYNVRSVDTTGAGDTFTGYYLASIAENESIPKALKIASAAAAISVTKKGAAISIPNMETVLNFIDKNM